MRVLFDCQRLEFACTSAIFAYRISERKEWIDNISRYTGNRDCGHLRPMMSMPILAGWTLTLHSAACGGGLNVKVVIPATVLTAALLTTVR